MPYSNDDNNKLTRIEQHLKKIIDMLEKLKSDNTIHAPMSPVNTAQKLHGQFSGINAIDTSPSNRNIHKYIPKNGKLNFESYREPSPITIIPDTDEEEGEEFLDDAMEIDVGFFRKKEPPTSVATIKTKIKNLVLPACLLDSGAECSLISHDIAKKLKLDINTNEKYDLSGASTVPTESIGTTPEIYISLGPGICTVREKFVVIDYNKPFLAFSNPFIKKHKCNIDWDLDELRIPFGGGEYKVIPVTMHRVKNNVEVNVVTKTNEPLQSNSDEDIDLKKSCVNCEGYKKDLCIALKSKAEIRDFCEQLQTYYRELEHKDVNKTKID